MLTFMKKQTNCKTQSTALMLCQFHTLFLSITRISCGPSRTGLSLHKSPLYVLKMTPSCVMKQLQICWANLVHRMKYLVNIWAVVLTRFFSG